MKKTENYKKFQLGAKGSKTLEQKDSDNMDN